MRKCAVWVTTRQYSPAGPCENRRELSAIEYDGRRITACKVHREMIRRGHQLLLTNTRVPAKV